MRKEAGSPLLLIGTTGVLAVLLAIYPLPAWLAPARPDFMALLAIYWVVRAPDRFGMGSAWLAGLLLDAVAGGLLGPRALELAVVAYFALILRPRMLYYPLPQQMGLVCAMVLTGQILCHWAQGVGGAGVDPWFLMCSLTSAFCWPLVTGGAGRSRGMERFDAAA
jgi:rod shape-determining protein MreD